MNLTEGEIRLLRALVYSAKQSLRFFDDDVEEKFKVLETLYNKLEVE